MAYLLVDQLKIEKDTLRAGVIQGIVLRSNVMATMPFESIGALNVTVTRWRTLPSVAFRKIGAAYAEAAGSFETLQETIYPLGGDIDVDKVFVNDKNTIVDPRAVQTAMKLKAIAYTFNNYFINGDTATDADGIVGLKKRVALLPSNMSVTPNATTYANGLDVKASTTTMNVFLDLFDQSIYQLDEGICDIIFMNETALLNVSSVLRRLGLLNQMEDMFGRRIMRYGDGGPVLADIGVTADQSTKIIANTETTGSTTTTTSIYFCRYGVGEYLHGIEEYPLDVKDLGELQTGPQFRTRVDWPIGLALWNDRSVARLSSVYFTS